MLRIIMSDKKDKKKKEGFYDKISVTWWTTHTASKTVIIRYPISNMEFQTNVGTVKL